MTIASNPNHGDDLSFSSTAKRRLKAIGNMQLLADSAYLSVAARAVNSPQPLVERDLSAIAHAKS